MDYMEYMFAVPRKAVKFNHEITPLRHVCVSERDFIIMMFTLCYSSMKYIGTMLSVFRRHNCICHVIILRLEGPISYALDCLIVISLPWYNYCVYVLNDNKVFLILRIEIMFWFTKWMIKMGIDEKQKQQQQCVGKSRRRKTLLSYRSLYQNHQMRVPFDVISAKPTTLNFIFSSVNSYHFVVYLYI